MKFPFIPVHQFPPNYRTKDKPTTTTTKHTTQLYKVCRKCGMFRFCLSILVVYCGVIDILTIYIYNIYI